MRNRKVVGDQVREVGIPLPGLKRWRQQQLLTQKELAAAAGVSRATVANTERGETVTLATAQKLAEALDTTVDELQRETEEK